MLEKFVKTFLVLQIKLFQSGALGCELLECVYKHLDIVETDYFGLQYTDETGLSRWIDMTKSIKKQTSKQKGTPPPPFYRFKLIILSSDNITFNFRQLS